MTTGALPARAVKARLSPYQGLVPYSEADADWFFGRGEWSEVVADNLRAYRVTALYGASGVGKSSLLHAGMLRKLNDEAVENLAQSGTPRLLPVAFSAWSLDQPLAALKNAVCDAGEALLPNGAPPSREGSLSDALERWTDRLGSPLLLVLDQLEELFLYHERDDDPILRELTAVLRRRDPGVHFLLSIREDALADLDRFEGQVPGLGEHLLRLEHLDRDAGREAITEPLELWNRTVAAPDNAVEIETGLVEAVLTQVAAGQVSMSPDSVAATNGSGEAGIETPYLQLVLIRLWDEEQLAGSSVLRLETLDRLGGADRIVRTHLDTALASLTPAEQDLVGRSFRYLVTPSGTKIALRMEDLADYASVPPEQLEPLVEQLAGRVRVLRPAGDGRFEIYHDALAGPIVDWRGRWEDRQRRRRERRRLVVFASALVGLLAVVAGVSLLAVWALSQRRSAHRKEVSATSLALASLANLQQDSRLDVAFLLAREAYLMSRSPEARASLVTAFEKAEETHQLGILRADSTSVLDVALSRNGRLLATTGARFGARLLDLRTGRRLELLGDTDVGSLAFSPDGRTLAGGASFMVRLWDVESGRQLEPLRGHKAGVPVVDFSPDGHTLASASTEGVRLWDLRAHRRLGGPLPHTETVRSLDFSPDGTLLATGGYDRTVRLWVVKSRRQLGRPLLGHRGEVSDVAFSPDGAVLASGGQDLSGLSTSSGREVVDHTVRLWDVETHRALGSPLRWPSSVTSVAFSSEGTLAVGGEDATIRFWDVRRHRQLGAPLRGHSGPVVGLAFSGNGQMLVSAGASTFNSSSEDQTARLWDARADGGIGTVLRRHRGAVRSVVFAPGGRTLVSGGADQSMLLWDTRSGRPLSSVTRLGGVVFSVAYSPDGKTLAAGVEGRGLLLWDMRTGKRIGDPLTDEYAIYGLAFSPDGSLLASGDSRGLARLWDVRRHRRFGRPMRHKTGEGYDAPVVSVAFSPDGRVLATGADDSSGTLRLFDVQSQRQLGRPLRYFGDVDIDGIAFSPDGKVVASAHGVDKVVRFWDVASHKGAGSPLKVHASVMAVAFSPDGRTLATGGDDDTVRLWDVQTRRQLGQPLRGHSDWVDTVAFSPDGRTLASGSNDGTVRLWRGFLFGVDDRAYLDRRVCGFAGGNLTRAEWAEFAPGISYRDSCP